MNSDPIDSDDDWLDNVEMVPPSRPKGMVALGNVTKAGLPSDRTQIDSIIRESTNPRYAQHQARRQELLDRRVAAMKAKLDAFTDWPTARAQVDKFVEELRSKAAPFFSSSTARWIHLDMDAFFASCEERDNHALRDVPMAVGSLEMLSTANYAARRFGVVSAMPGYIARKLCPQLVLIPGNFGKYREASRQVEQVIFDNIGQHVSMPSLDEAVFALSGESIEETVARLREEIHRRTQLTCTAGIAPTRSLAKANILLMFLGLLKCSQAKRSVFSCSGRLVRVILFNPAGAKNQWRWKGHCSSS